MWHGRRREESHQRETDPTSRHGGRDREKKLENCHKYCCRHMYGVRDHYRCHLRLEKEPIPHPYVVTLLILLKPLIMPVHYCVMTAIRELIRYKQYC